jgi:uncharacterized protein
MPSNVTAKTKWARSKREIALLLIAVGVLCIAVSGFHEPVPRTLTAGSHHFKVETVATDGKQSKGLSGRTSLDMNKGMLFVFDDMESHCIWMKDMRFSIDVIWADRERQVVHLAADVSPDTYPKNFCSPTPASYVIELPAGSIDRAGIRKGQILNF